MEIKLRERVWIVFNSIDTSGSGAIGVEDIGLLHQSPEQLIAGITPDCEEAVTYAEWEAFMTQNYDTCGLTDFTSWLEKFERVLPLSPSQELRLTHVHQAFDTDCDACWSTAEVQAFLEHMNAVAKDKTVLVDEALQEIRSAVVREMELQMELIVGDEALTLEDWVRMWVLLKRSKGNAEVELYMDVLQAALPLSQSEVDCVEALFEVLDKDEDGVLTKADIQVLDLKVRRKSAFGSEWNEHPAERKLTLNEFMALVVQMKQLQGSQQVGHFLIQAQHKVSNADYMQVLAIKTASRLPKDKANETSNANRHCGCVVA